MFGSPDARRNMKSVEWSVEHDGTFIDSIVKNNLKAATGCDKKLMALFVSMRATSFSTGNIERIKHSFNIERHVFVGMDRSDISSSILNPGQLDNGAVVDRRFCHKCESFNFDISFRLIGVSKYV